MAATTIDPSNATRIEVTRAVRFRGGHRIERGEVLDVRGYRADEYGATFSVAHPSPTFADNPHVSAAVPVTHAKVIA